MATNNSQAQPKSAATRLRELLAEKENIIVCPGVYDGLTARIALREGFDCLYMVGLITSSLFTLPIQTIAPTHPPTYPVH
jgi:2-methylisocitrate lyase-like PEP mutase family enzyme